MTSEYQVPRGFSPPLVPLDRQLPDALSGGAALRGVYPGTAEGVHVTSAGAQAPWTPLYPRPAFLLARREIARQIAAAQAFTGDWQRGKASGLELALVLMDAAEADRGTGAVTKDLLDALVADHDAADRELELSKVREFGADPVESAGDEEEEMLLLPRAEIEHLRQALDGAFALIAKRPAPAVQRPSEAL